MQKLMGLVRRCVEDYQMIKPGERLAVGVSGGKDSLVLLQLLRVGVSIPVLRWKLSPSIWVLVWIIPVCRPSAITCKCPIP